MNVAVEFDDSLTTCTFVQSIDILSDKQKLLHVLFHFGQCQMAGIRLCVEGLLAPPRVPVLHEFWIALERFGSRKLFRFEFAPETRLGVAESRQSTFRRDSRACQGDDSPSAAQLLKQRLGKIHGQNDLMEVVTY